MKMYPEAKDIRTWINGNAYKESPDQFYRDLLEFSTRNHTITRMQADLLYYEAWERGHSNGYMEVFGEFTDLINLLSRCGFIKFK